MTYYRRAGGPVQFPFSDQVRSVPEWQRRNLRRGLVRQLLDTDGDLWPELLRKMADDLDKEQSS